MADLAITISAPASGTPGQTITATVTIVNNGPSTANAVTATIVLPNGVTTTITVTAIVNGGTSTTTIAYSVPLGSVTTQTFSGQVSSTTLDTNPGNNTATAQVSLSLLSDMSASFAGFPASAPVNSVVSGTANFVNTNSTNTATTAVFSLQLPIGLNQANVTVTSALLGSGIYAPATGLVTFPAAPSTVNVSPSATVSASISFLQTSTGVAGTGTTSALNDTNLLNNTSTFSVAASAADMSVSFASFPASAPVNSVVSGTANFVNTNSTNTATTAVFSLQLPIGLNQANVTVTSALLGSGIYAPATGLVTFPAAPSTVNVSPSATVSASISFLQTSTGVAGTGTTSALNDTNLLNNTNTFSVAPVSLPADVVTSVTVPANVAISVVVGGTVSFANIGGTPALNVGGTVTLPFGVVAKTIPVGASTATVAGLQVIVFPATMSGLGTVNPGVTTSFNFTFRTPVVTGTYSITSTVATTSPEAVTLNNVSSASMTLATPVTNANLSGRVYLDILRNKVFDSGTDKPLANFRVEVVRFDGTTTVVYGSALTNDKGEYLIKDLPAGGGFSIRFFDSGGTVIFGSPFNTSPLRNGQQVSALGNPSTGSNTITGPVTVNPATPFSASIDDVTLYPEDNVTEQNLPLDPSGVVYNSITREPVKGATVKLVYEGTGAFSPALQTLGGSDTQVTGVNGFYQFWFINSPPSGLYRLEVTQPTGYLPPEAVQGGVIGALPLLNAKLGDTKVQPQSTAPVLGVNGGAAFDGLNGPVGTQYFFKIDLNVPAGVQVFNNHIPLDPVLSPGALLVSKIGDKTVAEIGDSVQYTIRIRNTTVGPITKIKLSDLLPAGFRYILGTARLGGVAVGNPAGGIGRELTFDIGTIGSNATAELTYFVRLGVGSQQGDGTNRAQVVAPVLSNVALFKVTVQGGVFSSEGCIVGKVYVDCDGNAVQSNNGGSRELGVPGVRLVMLDGTFILTDSEGKYSICGVKPQTHVIKVDRTTLPKGSRMMPSSNRNAGVGDSLFVDLKGGELARADFIEGSCSAEVLDQVKARRAQGGVVSPEVEKKLPLKIENRPVEAIQQILPETRQQDAMPVKPAEAR